MLARGSLKTTRGCRLDLDPVPLDATLQGTGTVIVTGTGSGTGGDERKGEMRRREEREGGERGIEKRKRGEERRGG